MKFWFLTFCLGFSLNLMAQPLLFSSSSIPPMNQPWEVGISSLAKSKSSSNPEIRVKIFPHDLKNDFLHGRRDIKTEVILSGNDIVINGKVYETLKIKLINGELFISPSTGESFKQNKLRLNSKSEIKVIRKGNEDKSHSYLGELEVSAKQEEILIVNVIDLESYLRGVVPKESVASWPIEALKAQTLAARSYAYYHYLTSKKVEFDVDDTARFQVYAGVSAATEATDRAIYETAGEVLVHDNKIITAFFHAYSGGRTDSAKNIFGKHVDYCLGNEEIFTGYELRSEIPERYHWVIEWTTDPLAPDQLMKILKKSSHTSKLLKNFSIKDYALEEQEFNPLFASVKTLRFSQDEQVADINFVKIRAAIGWSKFPAYHFRLEFNSEQKMIFRGKGWGHHVGMSQWGAMMMAKYHAKNYSEILHHYYADVEIKNLTDL